MIVISPRARIVLYALLIGFVLIILLSIVGFYKSYNVRYVIGGPALIVLLAILVIIERYARKKQQ